MSPSSPTDEAAPAGPDSPVEPPVGPPVEPPVGPSVEPPVGPSDEAPAAPPAEAAPAEAWSQDARPGRVPAGPSLSFAFNLGKIPGQGEDSDPILRSGRELGLAGVFDGMGGAGGTVYETPEGPRTGAYLASRVARDVVEQRMLHLLDPEWHLDGAAVAQDLQSAVSGALVEHLAALKAPPSGLRSRLLRALPTTMALVALQRLQPDGDAWAAHLFWTGDSRAYALLPTGLHQLTLDDIRDEGDAMENLRADSVVSNAMSADTAFVVHHRQVELTAPFLVVAATDGCFGYVPSPMHVEHLLLTTLRDADDVDAWSSSVQRSVSAVTGDDAAMAVLGIGADLAGFRSLLSRRTAEVEREWIAPLDASEQRLRRLEQELVQARAEREAEQARLWAAYKVGYERHLGPADRRQGS